MLWHKRLGHTGEKGLQSLQGKGMVEGMPNYNLDFDFYEHCLYDKKIRVKFSFCATRANKILELIHSDVFGLVPIPSVGGYMYYVIFIYDLSRNTWLYLLRKKSKVFIKFKEYTALVENQTRRKIKVLSTDNGGIFYEKGFKQFCKECGKAC